MYHWTYLPQLAFSKEGNVQNHQEVSTDILDACSCSSPSELIPPEISTHVSKHFFYLVLIHLLIYFKKFLRMIKQEKLLKLYLNNQNHIYVDSLK